MYSTNCNEEATIKIIGKITQQFTEFEDFQKQIELRKSIEEVLYDYEVKTKETALVASDIDEKIVLFLATKKLEGMSSKTIKNYNYMLAKFSSCLKKPVSSIDTNDLRRYLVIVGNNIQANSVNSIIYCLKSFFSWLTNEGYIYKNPMLIIKATKVPKRLRHALTDEEVENLRQACKTPREKALIEFLISSGCRLGEIIEINKEDINWNERSLHVIGKGDKERKVYFSVKAKVLLKKYLVSRDDLTPALFVSVRRPHGRIGGRAIEREIDKIATRAGFEKSIFPHLMRHSFATHSINGGMPIHVLQHIMGHESAATTEIYAELSDENIMHEYKRIS